MASISEWVPTHLGTIFKMATIFQGANTKMIEITNFSDLSVDSYVFDNSKTEYWDCNFENPTW